LGSGLYHYYYFGQWVISLLLVVVVVVVFMYVCIYLSNISRGTQFGKQHEKKRLKSLKCKLVFKADSWLPIGSLFKDQTVQEDRLSPH
jgi:hypothetical protein